MTATSEEPVTWAELTSDELRQLDRQLPVVVPMGLVESHGPALTLGFDNDSAEHFARVACARAGAVLMPTMPYGFADEFREYPGTVGVSMDTLGHVVADLCAQIRRHGFHKIVFLAGHGANVRASQLGFERAWTRHPDLKLACWTWWGVVDLPIHHADEVETSFALLLGRTVH
ncbi:MAG: creatininase family protein, partial [Micromonosporaceae bacterium]